MRNIANYFGINLPLTLVNRPSPLFKSDRRVGVEVELEGLPIDRLDAKYWEVKRDGSLRNGGREFVTIGDGLFGVDLSLALKELTAFLHVRKPRVSSRTSIHIHLDVRDYDDERLKKLILFYLLSENLFYNRVSKKRRESYYCQRVLESFNYKDFLANILKLKGSSFYNVFRSSALDTKYTGFNLISIHRLGTVEFRHFDATPRFQKIVQYINMVYTLDNLVDLPVEYKTLVGLLDSPEYFQQLLAKHFKVGKHELRYLKDVLVDIKMITKGLRFNMINSFIPREVA